MAQHGAEANLVGAAGPNAVVLDITVQNGIDSAIVSTNGTRRLTIQDDNSRTVLFPDHPWPDLNVEASVVCPVGLESVSGSTLLAGQLVRNELDQAGLASFSHLEIDLARQHA